MNLNRSVQRLMEYLGADFKGGCESEKLLNFILLDSKNGSYPSSLSGKLMREMNIQIIDTNLISKRSAPFYDKDLLVSALLSLT
jgi:hypothetical protein